MILDVAGEVENITKLLVSAVGLSQFLFVVYRKFAPVGGSRRIKTFTKGAETGIRKEPEPVIVHELFKFTRSHFVPTLLPESSIYIPQFQPVNSLIIRIFKGIKFSSLPVECRHPGIIFFQS